MADKVGERTRLVVRKSAAAAVGLEETALGDSRRQHLTLRLLAALQPRPSSSNANEMATRASPKDSLHL